MELPLRDLRGSANSQAVSYLPSRVTVWVDPMQWNGIAMCLNSPTVALWQITMCLCSPMVIPFASILSHWHGLLTAIAVSLHRINMDQPTRSHGLANTFVLELMVLLSPWILQWHCLLVRWAGPKRDCEQVVNKSRLAGGLGFKHGFYVP